MRWSVLLLALMPFVAQAGEAPVQRLCAAAGSDGALAAEVEHQIAQGKYPFTHAEQLLTADCSGKSLLDRLIASQQAENLEYAVIDMGANVNRPLVQEEGGKLTLVQYLIQQSVMAPTPAARAFASDYMAELRDVDFNPNLLSLSMN